MFENILEKNISAIKNHKVFSVDSGKTQDLVDILNTKKIVMVSWLRNSWRTSLIHTLLQKTWSFDQTFYFNAELDTLGSIKNDTDMITLFDIHIRIYGIPKIIILQNNESVENIKNFISRLIATKKYKIILVWNNIKVSGIQSIECLPMKLNSGNITHHMYGWIPQVRIAGDTDYKNFLLKVISQDIITKDILQPYNIKNISLYYQVITYISTMNEHASTREIHRQLELHGIGISLLTLIDYINAWINTKLLKKCYLYDLKLKKEIQSKALYYFWDTGIRYNFSGIIPELLQNTLYLELQSRWYSVQWWKNGRFQFDFYAQHTTLDSISLSVDTSNDKNGIRKTARKLSKLWNNSQKYIIVQNKNSLAMRKFVEDWVQIVEIWEFIQCL